MSWHAKRSSQKPLQQKPLQHKSSHNEALLRRHLLWTACVIGIEQALPLLTLSLCAAALFIICAWLGILALLPTSLRFAVDLVFTGAVLAPLLMLLRWRSIKRAHILRRMELAAAQKNLSITALFDTNSMSHEALAASLWRLHQERITALLPTLNYVRPQAVLSRNDPYALRFLTLLLLIASAFYAGEDRGPLLLSALSGPTAQNLDLARLDIWIDPPPYTGRAPIILNHHDDPNITIPTHSTLIAHSSDMAELSIEADPHILLPDTTNALHQQDARATIIANGQVRLRQNGHIITRLNFTTLADQPPTIALNKPPLGDDQGQLTLSYDSDDDYGVVEAQALFKNPRVRGLRHSGRILIPAPDMKLNLPSNNGRGTAQSQFDLRASPWAGVYVDVQLSARDGAHQTGLSATTSVHLPQRQFTQPLARLLIEQRRLIAFSADDLSVPLNVLSTYNLDPALNEIDSATYINLRHIIAVLRSNRDDEALKETIDFIWTMANHIEDGALSDAEQALRAAEAALQHALQENADPREIQKLIDQYTAALNHELNELSQRDQGDSYPSQQGATPITPEQLAALVQQLQDKIKNNDPIGAQQALNQLQNIMRHLRAGRAPQDPGRQAAERTLSDLDHLMREQQMLQDKTQDQFSPPEQNKNGKAARPDPQLKKQQEQLSQRLNALRQQLDQLGQDEHSALDAAQNAMQEAARALGSPNNSQNAIDAEGQAIDNLQKGLQALAQNLGTADHADAGAPNGEGQNQGQGAQGADPLGRRSAQGRASQSPFDVPGASAAQRAQDILQELRKRLSTSGRSRDELDYLERLLKSY